jgi:hypothetical protein
MNSRDKKWLKGLSNGIEHPISECLDLLIEYCEYLEKKTEDLKIEIDRLKIQVSDNQIYGAD